MDGFSEPVSSHGSWEYGLGDRSLRWSDGVYRIHGVTRDRFELGPGQTASAGASRGSRRVRASRRRGDRLAVLVHGPTPDRAPGRRRPDRDRPRRVHLRGRRPLRPVGRDDPGRHRPHRLRGAALAPGEPGRAHRALQPAAVRRGAHARARGRTTRRRRRRGVDARSRPVQGDQRLPRPRRRRSAAEEGRERAPRPVAGHRHARATWRRRVRDRPPGLRAGRGKRGSRPSSQPRSPPR